MSSTFALPNTLLGTVRVPRLRRRITTPLPVTTSHTAERTPVVVATEPAAGGDAGVSGLPFLRIPASWQLTGNRPVGYLDHVAIAPAGVLAITTRRYLAVDEDEHVRRAWQDIRTAKGAAKLLELTLGDESVEVRPVLVLWGPGAPELENGYLSVKGVTIIDPARPEMWSHLFDAAELDEIQQAGLVERLRTLRVSSNDMPIALAS